MSYTGRFWKEVAIERGADLDRMKDMWGEAQFVIGALKFELESRTELTPELVEKLVCNIRDHYRRDFSSY
jgi:hypothetical protein